MKYCIKQSGIIKIFHSNSKNRDNFEALYKGKKETPLFLKHLQAKQQIILKKINIIIKKQ